MVQKMFYNEGNPDQLDVPLWPKQKEARDLAITDIRKQGFAILKIGQRGGKTHIASEVARCMEKKLVYVFDFHNEPVARDFAIPNYFCGSTIPDNLLNGEFVADRNMILIHEAFWLTNSFALFQMLREKVPQIPILVIGSNGPEFQKGWNKIGGHGYASWEINPNLKEKEIKVRENDVANFQRDFGKF